MSSSVDNDGTIGGTLTEQQEKIIFINNAISSCLSTVGSTMIMYIIIKSRKWHGSNQSPATLSPYTRLLFGLSFFDMIQSTAQALQPYAAPADTGTDATCSAVGAIVQLGVGVLLYNSFLSYYFMLSVRYSMTPDQFARYCEPYCHALAIGFALTTSGIGLVFDMFSEVELNFGCWIENYPRGCTENDQVCMGETVAWIYGGLPMIFAFLSITINNVVVYIHARQILRAYQRRIVALEESKTEQMIPHHHDLDTAPGGGDDPTIAHVEAEEQIPSSQRKQAMEAIDDDIIHTKTEMKRVQGMASQALLHVLTFFLSFGWIFASQSAADQGFRDGSKIFWFVLVPSSIFLPSQGFLNLIAFSRPSYIETRLEFPLESRLWCVRRAWFGPNVAQTFHPMRQ